nr:putative protein TPRXL [Penaeus vannamei]
MESKHIDKHVSKHMGNDFMGHQAHCGPGGRVPGRRRGQTGSQSHRSSLWRLRLCPAWHARSPCGTANVSNDVPSNTSATCSPSTSASHSSTCFTSSTNAAYVSSSSTNAAYVSSSSTSATYAPAYVSSSSTSAIYAPAYVSSSPTNASYPIAHASYANDPIHVSRSVISASPTMVPAFG